MNLKKAPLRQFEAWDGNPRSSMDRSHIDRLAASIGNSPEKGTPNLLQNLIAVPRGKKLIVIGGGHRLEALKMTAAAGTISWDVEIDYDERDIDLDDPKAIAIALEENSLRLPMDVIDECSSFARMAMTGMKAKDMAAQFSLTEKTVKQRIALGALPEEAKNLIRSGARGLAWGQAMTAADKATQAKILADIQATPTLWLDEAEVRKFLTEDTIPLDHALFETSLYKGPILRDLFEADRFQDRSGFWELQDIAIEAKKTELEAQGYQSVTISLKPVEAWRYGRSDDKAAAHAIIEVSPNGRVTVYENLVMTETSPTPVSGVIEDTDTPNAPVAKTPASLIDFGRTVRTAVLQHEVAGNPRKAKEIIVAGLLGHAESPFRTLRVRLKGDQRMRIGKAFDKAAENQRAVSMKMAELVDQAGIEAAVAILSDTDLDNLLALLVADRLQAPAENKETGLLATIGKNAGPIRSLWQPTEAFFQALPTDQLRRVALDILPVERQKGILSARKTQLVSVLMAAFSEAAEGSPRLDLSAAERINAWAPDWIDFARAPETSAEEDAFLTDFALAEESTVPAAA